MSDGGTGGSPPAGWYPDPDVAGQQRWWDGTAWTEHTAPWAGPGPASSPSAWQRAPATPTPLPAGGVAATPPDTWLWQSILTTLLCCLPLGIPGIVFASQAQGALTVGNLELARQKAQQARTFTLISVGVGVLPWSVLILPFLFGFGLLLPG